MRNQLYSRRQLILTAGLGITLPALPSLLYSKRAEAAECAPTKRFLAYMFPNGHHMAEHLPSGTGAGAAWTLPPMLVSMAELKSELTFVSGLENQQRRRELGDHAIGCGALLTARKPTANQQVTNTSVDQIIADSLAGCTRLPSLQLGTHNVGPADSFGTYYTRSISWRGQSIANADGTMSFPTGPATPLGKEIDVKKAFDRLFSGTDPNVSSAEAEKRRQLRKSVLDAVVPQQAYLKARLNPADRAKVDELFTGIRSLENELVTQPPIVACTAPAAPVTGMDLTKTLDYMHNLMVIAFQCDITRVITFMMGDALNDRNLSFIPEVAAVGGDTNDHSVSHHSGQADLVAKFRAMVLWKQGQIAGFLRKLKMATDADGQSLLNNTLVWISSDLADGNRHNHDDKPILLAGRLGGLVTPDRHVRFQPNRDYTKCKTFGDFYITLLDLFGIKTSAYGDDGKEAIVWNK